MGILVSIVIGALAGFLAGRIMNKSMNFIVCVIVGIIGAAFGSWMFSTLGLNVSSRFWAQLLVGTVGAVVLLFILSLFRNKYE